MYQGEITKRLLGPKDIPPDWDIIPRDFMFVGIEPCGTEYAFLYIPEKKPLKGWENFKHYKFKTGRKFDMTGIDWKETLSERPKKM